MSPVSTLYNDSIFQLVANTTTKAVSESNQHALLVAKIVTIVVMIIITMIVGLLPYLLDRCFKWTKKSADATRSSVVVQCLLFFSGGVLIATTLMHILPMVATVVGRLQKCHILASTPFALPEMLMCTGFYLMYLLEEIAHTVWRRHKNNMCKKELITSESFVRGEMIRNSVIMTSGGIIEESHEECVTKCAESPVKIENADKSQALKEPSTADEDVNSSMRGLGIILALCLHEVFGGMSIGLESTVGTVWFMFGAISAHKLVLAFCVGMELLVARTRKALAIAYMFVFSIMTPIGIGIGIAVSQGGDANRPSVPSGILQGIACGTLLNVVFFEILPNNHSGWRAYIASLIGFGLMLGLQVLVVEAAGSSSYTC